VKQMKKFRVFAALALLAALSACATVDGVGRDISGGANRVAGWF
jgi:predicted small secreted protein